MAMLNRTKIVNAMKDMVTTSAQFIDNHIDWIRTNPVDHVSGAQVQRQMLNHLMIFHEAFNNLDSLFGKKLNPLSADNLSLYKKLYLLARFKGDIPACQNIACEMEKELLSFIPDPAIEEAVKLAIDTAANVVEGELSDINVADTSAIEVSESE